MKKLLITSLCLFIFGAIQAQSLEGLSLDELNTLSAAKKETEKTIGKEIADIDKAIREFPGWTKGFTGVIGLDFAGSKNWFANDIETSSSTGLGIAVNAFANGNMDKYFLRNELWANYNTIKSKNTDRNDNSGEEGAEEELNVKTSYFKASNLSGFYFVKNVAISAKASYESTILTFNDPGQLSLSAGLTWTPNKTFTAWIHPLGYQWTLPSGDFSSAPGADIGASYTGTLVKGIEWTSNLSAFLAYKGGDPILINNVSKEVASGDLSNWTWLNTFAVKDIFKGIGLGASLGLRNNKQLGFGKNVSDGGGLQSFYNIGLSYAL